MFHMSSMRLFTIYYYAAVLQSELLSMEGAANVGSEMSRIHIAEKNKQMADMLKVKITFVLSISSSFN